MNDEMLRLSLSDVMNYNLLNLFVNRVFGYDLNENEYVYIQYKVINDNVILNIFDNKYDNRFKAYIFCQRYIDSDDKDCWYIDVNKSYSLFKEKGNYNYIDLLASLLITSDDNEKREIIDSLFDNNDIKDIFYKYFI